MTNKSVASSLSTLGKRLERLLYFGSLLLIICFVELYFVSASTYVSAENYVKLESFINQFESSTDVLRSAFEKPVNTKEILSNKISQEQTIIETRKKLGLPLQITKSQEAKSYSAILADVVSVAAGVSDLPSEIIGPLINVEKSPDELILLMRNRSQDLIKKPVKIWGIETPLIMPFQYGSTQYQVPVSFIAKALLFALAPLLIGWLGSLFITRRMELFCLRQSSDYQIIFPHVLNVLPLIFSSISIRHNIQTTSGKKAKQFSRQVAVNRIMCAVTRSLVLLLFILPMIAIFAYGAIQLTVLQINFNIIEVVLAAACLITLFVQAVIIILNEWVFLWGKEFYV